MRECKAEVVGKRWNETHQTWDPPYINRALLTLLTCSLTLFARPVVGDVGVAAVVLDAVARVLEPPVRLRALQG